jgi:hypothetical protein
MTRFRRYLFTYFTWKTLSNHVFEDLRKPKAPNILETKINELLSSELSVCHESISSLKILNDDLNTKLEVANKSSSCVEHVVIFNRCKDFDVNACNEHLIAITKLNDEVESLNAQLKTCKSDFDY